MSSTTGDPTKWRPKRAAGEMDAGGDDASAEATGNRASPDASAEAVSSSVVYANLWLFIWLKTIGSYDSGAFSAVLGAANGIAETWDLSTVEQGTLTSSVFLGNIIGCPLAGHLFSSYNERQVLNISLIVHTVFTFLFATFPQYHIALLNRFFIGLSLAFVVVYTPVWVDAFAPKDRQSVWMASHNAGVPLGIMMGYLLGAFLPSYTNIGWEWAFYLKCVVMVPTIFYIAGVDPRTINARSRSTAVHPSSSAAPIISSQDGFVGRLRRRWMSVWCLIHPLLTNSIFMCSVLAMSSLYFVATGLQNFVTQYLREPPFNAPMKTIMAGFGVSVVTAPVCGVITGGILLDRFGGYQGNLRRVALFALCWGCAAAVFAVVCIFVSSTGVFLLVMSVVLFCGGAIIPPGAGLTMSSLPDHLRSVGAAFSQTFYNTLGNFSGPMVCGLVADWTGELKYGIMTLMLSSVLGIIPMVTILIIAMRMPRVSTDNTAATIVIMNAEDEDEDAESSGIDTSGPSRSSQAAATRNTVEMEELAQPPTITQAAQRRWVMEEEDVRRSASGVLGLRSANSAGEWVGGGSPGVPPMTSSVCFNTSFPPPSNAAPLTQIHRPRVAIGEGQPREVAEAADSPTVVCSPRPGAPSPNMASLEHKALRHSHRASVPPPSAAVLSRNSSIQLAVHDGESLQDLTMPTPHMFGMDVVHSWLLVQGKSEDFGSAASLPRGAMQAEDSLPRGAALTEEGSQRAPTAENDSRAEP